MFAREVMSALGPGAALAVNGSSAATFTAAGTTLATGTPITSVYTNITTATEGQGVVLPGSMTASDNGMVCNSTSVDVYLYPPSGKQINGATAGVPVMIPPQRAVHFVCIDGNNYMVG